MEGLPRKAFQHPEHFAEIFLAIVVLAAFCSSTYTIILSSGLDVMVCLCPSLALFVLYCLISACCIRFRVVSALLYLKI